MRRTMNFRSQIMLGFAGVRGYPATGNEDYLEPYTAGKVTFERTLAGRSVQP